jgi:hypothetical protein
VDGLEGDIRLLQSLQELATNWQQWATQLVTVLSRFDADPHQVAMSYAGLYEGEYDRLCQAFHKATPDFAQPGRKWLLVEQKAAAEVELLAEESSVDDVVNIAVAISDKARHSLEMVVMGLETHEDRREPKHRRNEPITQCVSREIHAFLSVTSQLLEHLAVAVNYCDQPQGQRIQDKRVELLKRWENPREAPGGAAGQRTGESASTVGSDKYKRKQKVTGDESDNESGERSTDHQKAAASLADLWSEYRAKLWAARTAAEVCRSRDGGKKQQSLRELSDTLAKRAEMLDAATPNQFLLQRSAEVLAPLITKAGNDSYAYFRSVRQHRKVSRTASLAEAAKWQETLAERLSEAVALLERVPSPRDDLRKAVRDIRGVVDDLRDKMGELKVATEEAEAHHDTEAAFTKAIKDAKHGDDVKFIGTGKPTWVFAAEGSDLYQEHFSDGTVLHGKVRVLKADGPDETGKRVRRFGRIVRAIAENPYYGKYVVQFPGASETQKQRLHDVLVQAGGGHGPSRKRIVWESVD